MLSITLMIAALFYNGLVYQNLNRSLICLAILILTAVHFMIFDESVSFMYYGTAALSCLITITILELMPKSPLVVDIQLISFGGILANFFGYGMYEAYQGPFAYNAIMLCLFIIELVRLMVRTKNDREYGCIAGDFTIHSDGSSSGKSGA